MSEDLKKHLYRHLNSIQGLCAIVVSDRDGVPVLKVMFFQFLERFVSQIREYGV